MIIDRPAITVRTVIIAPALIYEFDLNIQPSPRGKKVGTLIAEFTLMQVNRTSLKTRILIKPDIS